MSTPLIRDLGGFEYFMWKAHKIGCGLIYCIADLEGPVTSDFVQKAAMMCTKRHPNLRSQILPSGQLQALSLGEFSRTMTIQVPLITERSAIEVTEEQLISTPIALASLQKKGPLWQLFLVQHQGKQQLVSLTHHSIMDGESVILFLKEIVENMAKIYSSYLNDQEGRDLHEHEQEDEQHPQPFDSLLDEVEELPFCVSQDDLFEEMSIGDGIGPNIGFFLRRMAWLLARPSVPKPDGVTQDIRQRKDRIVSAQIAGEAFKALLKRCKQEETTVTGAIAAAVMFEIKSHMTDQGTSAALKMETMVNLRSKIAEKHPEYLPGLSLFAAPIDMVIPINDEEEVWPKARVFKQDLTEAMERGQWKKQVAGFNTFRRLNDGVYRLLEKASIGPTQGRVKAAAISNLGVLDEKFKPMVVTEKKKSPAEAGGGWSSSLFSLMRSLGGERGGEEAAKSDEEKTVSFAISRLQWGITEHGMGHYFFVAISSQNGQLNLTITCASPMISEERAKILLKGIVNRLTIIEDEDVSSCGVSGKEQQEGVHRSQQQEEIRAG